MKELIAGGPQKEWVQSQTTFAQLAKDDDGSYRIRTLKQKIWVKGVSYELQEIFGIEHATAAAKEREVRQDTHFLPLDTFAAHYDKCIHSNPWTLEISRYTCIPSLGRHTS